MADGRRVGVAQPQATLASGKMQENKFQIDRRRRPRRRAGFSLLELLAVVTILGIVAVIIIPRVSYSRAQAQEQACFQNKAEINTAIERYNIENGELPDTMADLNNATWFPDGIPNCPVSNNAYVLNGAKVRVQGHTTGSH
ncbi:MAG: type II secretion system protein [Planctomycetota bacterium]|nr:MAG: type II secretion system protein [Planctomycetota bacterium]REK25472.1 MAG: type II secretion system protein [Planctomycetota bacterium]REK40824.1 MAG: type II secretion system protein [Planctomycetota bacterium]